MTEEEWNLTASSENPPPVGTRIEFWWAPGLAKAQLKTGTYEGMSNRHGYIRYDARIDGRKNKCPLSRWKVI